MDKRFMSKMLCVLFAICCCLTHMDNCFMDLLLFANCFMSNMLVCHLLLFATYGQLFHVKNASVSFAVVCHRWITVSCQTCLCVICCCLPHMDNCFMSNMIVSCCCHIWITVSCQKCLCVICCCLPHMDNCFMSNMRVSFAFLGYI